MNKNLDLRITKTDKMIRDAFLELIDTIGFEKITITNLTNKAMINRTTFYLHYTDKYDLLEQIENNILDELEKITSKISLDSEEIFSLLLKMYKYIEKNQKIFKLLICNNIDPSFYFKLNKIMKHIYYKNIDKDVIKIPEHYLLSLITGIHMSTINEWIKSGMKETPEEIVSILIYVIHNLPQKVYK